MISPRRSDLGGAITDVFRSWDLVLTFARREVQLRYTQTALGVVWVLLQPLVPALIFATVFSAGRMPSAGHPYLVFALAGFVIWTLIAGSLARSALSLVVDARLITKVYFPRLVLPVAAALSTVIDFGIGLVALTSILIVTGTPFLPTWLAIPLIVGWALIAVIGLGAGLAALGGYYRDFEHAVPFLLQILLFASPVLYSPEWVPADLRVVYALNPFVGIIESFRWAVLGGAFPTDAVAVGLMASAACVVIGLVVFARIERGLADII